MSQFSTFFVPHGDDGTAIDSLNILLRTKRVVQVEKQAFPNGWAFCVEWLSGAPRSDLQGFVKTSGKVDYRDVLEAPAFARFVKFRERRKAIADADGIKPYVVMTDAQMAELAKMENPNLTEMKKISGVGEARVKMYGDRLLGCLDETTTPSKGETSA